MKISDWLKNQRKKILVHSLIISTFLLYCFFLSEPFFDQFEKIPGESRLHRISLPAVTNNIIYRLDRFDVHTATLKLSGWAFVEGQNSENSQTYLVLQSDSNTYVFDTENWVRRYDVTKHFRELGLNLDRSSFYGVIPLRKLKAGDYSVGLYIRKGNIEALQFVDKYVRKTKDAAEIILHASKLQKVTLPAESNNLRFNIEAIQDVRQGEEEFVEIRGWTFIEGQSMENSKIFLVLRSDSATHVYDTILQKRPDVTVAFRESKLNLDNSGFIARIPKEEIEKGTYKLGIYIMHEAIEALQYTTKEIYL